MSDTQIDTRGLNCPLPVIKAEKALARLNKGQSICLLATDPLAEIDIPHMCTKHQFTLLSVEKADDVLRFEIQK